MKRKKRKKKVCQLCGKRQATVGWNCKRCNDGIIERDQQRIDIADGSKNYCGGY